MRWSLFLFVLYALSRSASGFVFSRCAVVQRTTSTCKNMQLQNLVPAAASEFTGYTKILPPAKRLSRAEDGDALQELLRATRLQNTNKIGKQLAETTPSDLNRQVRKLLPQVSAEALQVFWEGSVLSHDDIAQKLDLQTHTAAMSALNRLQRHEATIHTYEGLLRRNTTLDTAAFNTAVRASVFCRTLPYTLQLLESAHGALAEKCVDVVDTAIQSMAHTPHTAQHAGDVKQILNWLTSKGLTPFTEIMDSALAVVCAHGTDADCSDVLHRKHQAGLPSTIYSFNTLLGRAARQGNEAQALEVVTQMRAANVTADSTTYNTLLRLYENQNNPGSALKVAEQMLDIPHPMVTTTTVNLVRHLLAGSTDPATSATTKTLLTRLVKQSRLSTVVITDAIASSADAATAKALFAQAIAAGEDDTAVYLATAQRLAQDGDYRGAFGYINRMLQRGVPITRDVLAFMLNVVESDSFYRKASAGKLRDYVMLTIVSCTQWCLDHQPSLLTHKVLSVVFPHLNWNFMRSFDPATRFAAGVLDKLPGSAKYFHRGFVDRLISCVEWPWTEGLGAEFGQEHIPTRWLQFSKCTVEEGQHAVVACGEFLISLCTALQRDGTGRAGLHNYLHSYQFDDVMRMLDNLGRQDMVAELYYLMRLGYSAGGVRSEYLDGGDMSDTSHSSYVMEKLAPAPVAVWLAVRAATMRGDVDMLVDALQWSLERRPPALSDDTIRPALKFLYSAGQRALADRWYERLYRLGFITHWLSKEDPDRLDRKGRAIREGVEDAATRSVLDLQGFCRGMAHAAIRSAIEEVQAREHVVDLAVTIGEREDLRHTQEDQSEDEDQDQKQELGQNQDEQLGRMVRSERDIRSMLESFAPPLRLRFDPEKPDRVVVLLTEDSAH